MQSAFELEFMDPGRHTFVSQRPILFVIQVFQASLEAQGTLLELAQLLITHRHVVKDLQSNELVT